MRVIGQIDRTIITDQILIDEIVLEVVIEYIDRIQIFQWIEDRINMNIEIFGRERIIEKTFNRL